MILNSTLVRTKIENLRLLIVCRPLQLMLLHLPITNLQTSSPTNLNVYKDLPLPLKGLNFCHMNVCSLTNKLDEIKLILSSRITSSNAKKPNLLLGLSETFFDDSWDNATLAVDHCTIVRADRKGKKGGALLLYVPDNVIFKRRLDLEINGVECLWIEIIFPHSKPILVSFVYRPPSSDASFLDIFDSMLSKVKQTLRVTKQLF